MRPRIVDWIIKFLKYTSFFGAILYILLYILLAILRVRYPFELEWMEGASVDYVIRILSGDKIYVQPSLEFIPFLYTPLYFHVSAIISRIFGVGFFSLRLVSLISSLGCFSIIFLFVEKETKSKFAAFLAVGLFAATYRLSGSWFDLARVDSLFLMLLLAAFFLIRFNSGIIAHILAGILVALSFQTKQTAIVISLPIMLYCFIFYRRRSIYFIGTALSLIAVSSWYLNYIHNGWYNYYVFYLPRQHSIVEKMIIGFWSNDLLLPLQIAIMFALLYIASQITNFAKKDYLFYLFFSVGMIGGSWFSRLNWGGFNNVLFPAYAAASILFGLGVNAALISLQVFSKDRQDLAKIILYISLLIQFAVLVYDPALQVPNREDIEAGRKLVNTIEQIEGEVYLLNHAYLPTLADKSSHAHGQALADVLWNDKGQTGIKLDGELRQAIHEQRFSAIIFDNLNEFPLPHDFDINRYYRIQAKIFDNGNVFWPVTGVPTRPEYLYVPIDQKTDQ